MHCESISLRPWRVLRRALESGALLRMMEGIDRFLESIKRSSAFKQENPRSGFFQLMGLAAELYKKGRRSGFLYNFVAWYLEEHSDFTSSYVVKMGDAKVFGLQHKVYKAMIMHLKIVASTAGSLVGRRGLGALCNFRSVYCSHSCLISLVVHSDLATKGVPYYSSPRPEFLKDIERYILGPILARTDVDKDLCAKFWNTVHDIPDEISAGGQDLDGDVADMFYGADEVLPDMACTTRVAFGWHDPEGSKMRMFRSDSSDWDYRGQYLLSAVRQGIPTLEKT